MGLKERERVGMDIREDEKDVNNFFGKQKSEGRVLAVLTK